MAKVAIQAPAAPGMFLRRVGEDVRAGDVVLHAGTRLSPRHVALLAAIGRDRVMVRPRPRVVVISTGSELVGPGRTLGHGQIHDSNGYGLTAAAREAGRGGAPRRHRRGRRAGADGHARRTSWSAPTC